MSYAIGFLFYEWLRKSQIDAARLEGLLRHFVFIQYSTLTITYKIEYESQMRL